MLERRRVDARARINEHVNDAHVAILCSEVKRGLPLCIDATHECRLRLMRTRLAQQVA